jgi:hypothetical protein
MLAGLLICTTLLMRFAPQSQVSRMLNRRLVEQPLQMLANMRRHHLIFMLLAVAFLIAGAEVIFALGSVDFTLVYALDLSLYIDGLLATLAIASLARTRSGATALRLRAASFGVRLRRVFGRRRVRNPAVRRPARKPSNDDRPAPMPLAA